MYGQLVDGGRTERIRSADIDVEAGPGELGREFADCRGLAGTVHADDHDNVGDAFLDVESEVFGRAVRLLHQLSDLVAQDRLQLRGVHILVPCDAGFDAFDDLHGGFHAYVGGDEHLLQIVEHLCIDGRSTGDGSRQFREEARFGLLQTGVEFRLFPVSGSGSRLGRGIFLLRRIFDRSRPVVFRRSRLRSFRRSRRLCILFFLEKIEESHKICYIRQCCKDSER